MTTAPLQLDQTQIAELIASKLAADSSFRSNLMTALAREATTGANSKLKATADEAAATLAQRISNDLDATATKLRNEGDQTLRKKFEEQLRNRSSAFGITDEWLHKTAGKAVREIIFEAFGRRAHRIAEMYLASSARKLDLLRDGGEDE
jgi:hypothetical protein